MSALTKVFVVLHVVVSLLFVAGVVVFVNKVEDFGASARAAKDELRIKTTAQEAERVKSQMILAEKEKAIGEAADRASALAAAKADLESQVTALNTQLASAQADKGMVTTQLTTAGNALKVAQDANLAQEKVGTDLRNRIEDLEKKYTDSQVALSDLNNRLDASNSEVRYAREQVAALTTELTETRRRLAAMPAAPTPGAPGAPGAAAPGAGAPAGGNGGVPAAPTNLAVRGVVKSKFQVGQVEYATVGLGAADGVTKGTRFNVIDPNGTQFLGYLTVDTVGPNEASGHLTGPNVNAIQKGSTVLTNWQ